MEIRLLLNDWDDAYLAELATLPDETAWLEKKASAAFEMTNGRPSGKTKDEIAKQVCAFANASNGFLIFGIDAAKRVLDSGVAGHVGRTPIKDWVEQTVPQLLQPAYHLAEARHIPTTHHLSGLGVLAIAIRLSDSRPHWVHAGGREQSYIRAGAHSLEMPFQTVLDVAARRGALPRGEVCGLGSAGRDTPRLPAMSGTVRFRFIPKVRLVSGPLCKRWGLEMRAPDGVAFFVLMDVNSYEAPRINAGASFGNTREVIFIPGSSPLFPRRDTPTIEQPIIIEVKDVARACDSYIEATLFLESAPPITQQLPMKDLFRSSGIEDRVHTPPDSTGAAE